MVVVSMIVAAPVIVARDVDLVNQDATGRIRYEVKGRLRAATRMPFRVVVDLVAH